MTSQLNRDVGTAGLVALAVAAVGFLMMQLFPSEDSKRKRIVGLAMKEIGAPRPSVYWTDVYGSNAKKDWCGVFALWAIHQAGLAKNVKWVAGKGFLYLLPKTLLPKPGDIAYFNKYEHHAIVGSVNPDGTITTINGNDTGGSIGVNTIQKSSVTAFYSIEPFLKG